ncbi:MAG: HAD-IIB family hydrolase [Hyphomicrobiaceae bacterium]|nr:HAD-IIB family hydrolase [Hyphomicrobiaceae bacterium]
MRPIAEAPANRWSALRFVFSDIDDTLTTDGRLGADAYAMLEKLAAAGLVVIPVTGRPAGWCDMIARFWPVGAVVGENGAFYFRYNRADRRLIRVFAQADDERGRNRTALDALRSRILADVPGAGVASDQAYREADLAIDFCEDVDRLSDADISRIVDQFEAAGATAKVSSIHVNGWFGDHDKLTMTRRLMRDQFGLDIDSHDGQRSCAFIGDSPNDAPMFGFFETSVGVANITALADRCAVLPKWVTTAESGAGFCEFARVVLAARS